MNIFRIAVRNIQLPRDKRPTRDTVYMRSERMANTEGRSNKEYIVRIYRYPDGMYSTIGFSGRIGGSLTMQPKALTRSLQRAMSVMSELLWKKEARGYQRTGSGDHPRVPGIHELEVESEATEELDHEPIVEPVKEEAKEESVTEKEWEEFEKSDLAELMGYQKNNWYKKSQREQRL